ncbi:XrtA/PEP-CTERM system TPR-repeat protein PrsT [Thiohalophilus thiocyanatoxydans]|nr:XrtA/PEP-CTERM system TPR-repeat protein PrsT [Thiohalophilus thiocyanatoxydans]
MVSALLLLSGCGENDLSDTEHVQRGIEHRQQGDLRASVIELKNALQKNPSSEAGRWQLGLTYLAMDDGVRAEAEILRARDLGRAPGETAVALARAQLLQGRFDQALVMLDEYPVAADDPQRLARSEVIRGLAYLGKAQPERAARFFKDALEKEPQLSEAMLGMARVSEMEGELDQADHWIDQLLEREPEHSKALRVRGDIARARGDLDAADAAYSKAIRYAHNPYELHLRRAMLRLDREPLDAVEEDLKQLRRLAAEHPMTYYVSGLWHSRNERYADAQADFEAVLNRHREHQPTLYLLGANHFAQGHWNQAESYLQRYLSENPGSPQAVALLARIRMQQQRISDAVRVLEEGLAASVSPQPVLSEMLASLYLQQGQQERGLQILQSALSDDPDSTGLQESLGLALMRSGERDDGLEALRKASGMDDQPRRADAAVVLAHLQAREYDEALDAAQRYREKQPDSAEAHNFIGAVLMGLDRNDEARAAFNKAIELEPDNVTAAMNLGSLETRLGHRDAARQAFESIQAHDPGHPLSAQRLAGLEALAGRPQAARRWLEGSLETYPDNLTTKIMLARVQKASGEDAEALRTLNRAMEQHAERLPAYFATAELLRAMDRTSDALQVLSRAEALAPESAEVQRRLASAREQAGEYEAMQAHLRKAVKLDPADVASRVSLAMALARAGALDSAREQLASLQASHGERAEVHALSGWFALRDGEIEAGAESYAKALAQRQHRPWVMELFRARQTLGDHAGAVTVLTRWLEQSPGDAAARHALATQQIATGNAGQAIGHYEKILDDAPDDVASLNNLAWLLGERDTDRALKLIERARELAPESAAVHDTLGVVLFYSGDLVRSARVLQDLAADSPEDPAVNFHLARTLHVQGNIADAQVHLDRALASQSGFTEREAALRLQQTLAR